MQIIKRTEDLYPDTPSIWDAIDEQVNRQVGFSNMGPEYASYLQMHIAGVKKAFGELTNKSEYIIRISEILPDINTSNLSEIADQIDHHDASKYCIDECVPYEAYFYSEKTPAVEKAFDRAWLMHIHRNPHHWQYWILKEDDSDATGNTIEVKTVEMPDNYIIEMVCDWWSFSWKKVFDLPNPSGEEMQKALEGIFDWYEESKNKIVLAEETRKKVEKLLDLIRVYILDLRLADV